MADTADDQKQAQNLELRKALNDAYASIEGQKIAQAFTAFTYEDALDLQINRLVGPDTATRPNEVNKVARTLANVTVAIAQIKSQPPDAFIVHNPETDANTPA